MAQSKETERSNYGRRLEELIRQKGYTPKDLAKDAGFSYQHLNHLLNGNRTITLEILKKIVDALDLNKSEVASLSLLKDKPVISKGKNTVPALIANRSGERTAGTMLFLSETMIEEKYPEYTADQFMDYASKYIYETYYANKFAEIEEEQKKEKATEDALSLNTENQHLREIVELLYDVEPKALIYIKESIELFIKHYQ